MKLIHANAKSKFTENDFVFIEKTLADGAGNRRSLRNLLRQPDMLDLVLDNSKLLDDVLAGGGDGRVSVRLFYYLAIRYELLHAGVERRAVAEYLTEFIVLFAPQPRMNLLLAGGAFDYRYILGLMQEIDRVTPESRFVLACKIANYALMICGLCPERIIRHIVPGAPEANDIGFYEKIGFMHFQIAANDRLSWEHKLDGVYGALLDDWEIVVGALRDFSRQFLLIDNLPAMVKRRHFETMR